MRKAKRVWSLLLAFVMIVSGISTTAFAESGETDNSNVQTYQDDYGSDESKDEYRSNGVTFSVGDGQLAVTGDGVVGLKNYVWDNAEYELDMDFSEKTSEWAGVQFNKESPTDQRDTAGYMLYVRRTGSVELYTGSTGVFAKGKVTFTNEKKVHLKISVVDGKIKVYANGEAEPIISVEDDTYSYGYFSFVNYMTGTIKYDNLKITAKASDGKIRKLIVEGLDNNASLEKGKTVKLTSRVIPSDAKVDDVTWQVTDVYGNPSALATISEDGYLTAGNITGVIKVGVGTTDGSDVSGMITISITDESEAAETETSIVVNKNYFNDFTNADSDYTAYRATSEIKDGKLVLNASGITMTSVNNRTWGNATYAFDLDICEAQEWAGFMFARTETTDIWDNSGYMFLVTPSGDYQILRGGSGTIASGKIDSFVNEENHYEVDKTANGFTVYCNDTLVAEVTDNMYQDGYAAFTASTSWDRTDAVKIDNFKVEVTEEIAFEDDFARPEQEVVFKDYGSAASTVKDGCLQLKSTFNGITNLEDKKFANATYAFDLNIADGSEWASILFNKVNPTDTWDWSGYMFLVQTSGSYQLICAGNGQIASGTIPDYENKLNHYKIATQNGAIVIYYNDSEEPFVNVETTAYEEGGYVSFGISNGTASFDNFIITDAEGTELYSNDFEEAAIEEPYEVVKGSSYSITDGVLELPASWGGAVTSISSQSFDTVKYEFDMDVDSVSDWGAFMFQRTKTTDAWDDSGYLFLVQPSGAYQFHASTGSGLRQLASGTIPEFAGGMGHYRIEKTDSTINIYYSEQEDAFISVQDSTYETGYAGFAACNTGSVKFKNLVIAVIAETVKPELEDLYITGAYGTTIMQINSSMQMHVYTEPADIETDKLNWSVKNADNSGEALATIDNMGILTAKGQAGVVTVTAEAANGMTSSVDISIEESVPVTAMTVTAQKNARIMGVNTEVQMLAQMYPYTANAEEVRWTVTNTDGSATDLAEITTDGVLKSKAAGTVRVHAQLAEHSDIYSEWIMTIGAITTDGENAMKSMKYSFFAHYVADLTTDVDGNVVEDPNELADAFDAEAYADKMAAMGVEYVVFTAWHYRMVVLYDSQVMLDWDMANHRTDRDLIGDMIDAVQARGINVVLYTHAFDGYDFETAEEGLKVGWGSALKPALKPNYDGDFDYDKWNNFINDVYGEVMERYGDRIAGIWVDEGNMWEGMSKAVDFPRLLKTIRSYNPNVGTFQNDHGFLYGFTYRIEEYWKQAEFADYTGNSLKTFRSKIPNPIIGNDWWTTTAKTSGNVVPYSGSVLFMYQVLQSGASSGGGIQWAAGPYPGEGCEYENGVVETMEAMNAYLNPIAWTVKNTLASTSYVTANNKTIKTVGWGVATKSTDDTREYIHVLCPDDGAINGRTLTLEAPADYKIFTKAYLAVDNQPVKLEQTDSYVKLTLPEGTIWNDVDTVIELVVDKEATAINKKQKETVGSVTLNKKSITTMRVGSTLQLSATVKPSTALNKSLKWTTSNAKIATVSQSGKVTAKKRGTVTITATARDGSKKSASVKIKVTYALTKKVTVTTKGLASNQKATKLYVVKGKKVSIKGTVSPTTAKQGVTYINKNPKIVSISKKGVIKAKKTGKAIIYVKSADGRKKIKVTVYVVKKTKTVKSLKVSKKKLTLKVGKTSKIKTAVKPVTTTSRVTYTVKNKKIATVDKYGKVTAKKKGTTRVTVKCGKKTVKVTVKVTK